MSKKLVNAKKLVITKRKKRLKRKEIDSPI